MKKSAFVLFFGVFFAVYGLLNYYIFQWGWEALPAGVSVRVAYGSLFFLVASAFIFGRVLERVWLGPVAEALVWIGSFWLAAMLYLFLGALVLDLLRWTLVPGIDVHRGAVAAALALVVILLLVAGHINAAFPVLRTVELTIPKHAGRRMSLTIAVASDIHLGTIIGRRQFDRIVARMNALDPDLVLLPGDIVDEDLGPVIRENLGERLRAIRSRLGVLAVTGNHEYIGGAEKACAYLVEHGIRVLRDEALGIDHSFFVVGREDRSITQFAGKRRKSLEELMAGVDRGLPVIVMDHQPFRLEEAERCGADLQLSGHTHHGQLWPLNFITGSVYEVSRGYLLKGSTHFYVSNGVGTWGPPVRIGNRPEILHIVLRFQS